jgi:hypothetical protein
VVIMVAAFFYIPAALIVLFVAGFIADYFMW